MALNGSINTNAGYNGRYYQVTWTATQSVADNTSTIAWTLKSLGFSGWVAERTLKVVIAGSTVVNKTDRVERYNETIATGTVTLSHGSDGTKSFSVSIEAAVYYSTITCTGSSTFTLDTIPRASTISVGTLTMGTAGTITISKANSNFTHTISYGWGDTTTSGISSGKGYKGTIVSQTSASSVSWTPSKDLAKVIPNATSGTGFLVCDTYSGSTKVGSSNITFNAKVPTDIIPTINSASVAVDNSANSVIAGWGLYVAGYSKAKITATASGSYGSIISSFTVSGGYSVTQNGTSLSYTGDTLSSSGSKSFNVVANDSRGRSSASKSAGSITVYAYSKPAMSSFSISRSSSDPTKVVAKANWTYASVNGKNVTTATLKYKKTTATTWTTYGTIPKNTNTTLTSVFEETSSYNFQIVVTDSLSNSAEAEAKVSTVDVLLDFRAGGKGLGIGKIAETDSLEVAMASKFYRNMYISHDCSIYSYDETGDEINVFQGISSNGNTAVGYGNYARKDGNTNIYGNDVYIYTAAANNSGFRPYYRAGDSTTVSIDTAGYSTSSSTNVYFTIPLCKPILGSPTITVASTTGFILRQNGNYTHGSSSSVSISPSSISANYVASGIRVCAIFSSTTNAVNNAPIGVRFVGTITFS